MVLGHNVHNDGENQQRCKVLKGAQPVGEVEGLDRGLVEDGHGAGGYAVADDPPDHGPSLGIEFRAGPRHG